MATAAKNSGIAAVKMSKPNYSAATLAKHYLARHMRVFGRS